MPVVKLTGDDPSNSQLRQCVELLLEIVEGSSQPFVIADASGLIVGSNSAFCRLVGYSKEELGLKRVAELTPQEWRKQESGIIAGQVRSKMPAIYRKEYTRKDGMRVPVELYDHVIFDKAGHPLYFYAFVTDVTENKGR
jgi:PAS domain S-box-containing protein